MHRTSDDKVLVDLIKRGLRHNPITMGVMTIEKGLQPAYITRLPREAMVLSIFIRLHNLLNTNLMFNLMRLSIAIIFGTIVGAIIYSNCFPNDLIEKAFMAISIIGQYGFWLGLLLPWDE